MFSKTSHQSYHSLPNTANRQIARRSPVDTTGTPFWQQAYTNLIKIVIQPEKVLCDYVTCSISTSARSTRTLLDLDQKIVQGDAAFGTQYVLIGIDDFLAYGQPRKLSVREEPRAGSYFRGTFQSLSPSLE